MSYLLSLAASTPGQSFVSVHIEPKIVEGRANYLIKILLRFDGVGDLVLLTLQGQLACA